MGIYSKKFFSKKNFSLNTYFFFFTAPPGTIHIFFPSRGFLLDYLYKGDQSYPFFLTDDEL